MAEETVVKEQRKRQERKEEKEGRYSNKSRVALPLSYSQTSATWKRLTTYPSDRIHHGEPEWAPSRFLFLESPKVATE
jgi:hypothetical protein